MSQSKPKRVVRRGRIFPEIQWSEEEKARHKARQQAFYQRCWSIFEQLKPTLIEKYYGWYIAIEPDTGDYFIDSAKEVTIHKARQKYPHAPHHIFGINESGVSGRI